MLELSLQTEEQTEALARRLAAVLDRGDVIALEGRLGAGKTTFARAAIYGLGVPEETAITSPTFALLHQYQGRVPVAHLDFYRLADEAELEELGLDELVEDGAVLFVEWGRKFPWLASRACLCIELEIVSDTERRARFHALGARGEDIVSTLCRLLAH